MGTDPEVAHAWVYTRLCEDLFGVDLGLCNQAVETTSPPDANAQGEDLGTYMLLTALDNVNRYLWFIGSDAEPWVYGDLCQQLSGGALCTEATTKS